MLAKLRQLLLGLAVVGVALGAGLIAAGIIEPSGFVEPSPTGRAPGETGRNTSDPPASLPPLPTPTPAGETAVLVGAGDIADCERPEDELTSDLVNSIAGTVFTLGDNAYPDGTARDFEECYGPTWGRPSIKDRTRPTPGDNEYDTPNARGYYSFFGDAAGDPSRGYYAYDAGTWRVYVLNSECAAVGGCGPGSPQEAWLTADLESEPRDCVLAMWHHPYFTSGPSGGLDATTRNFWRLLQGAGAELVLSGHDHVYERFAPQTGEGLASPGGMVQFVVGTGGGDPDRFHNIGPNSIIRERAVYGVLVLRLRPGSYDFEFITVAGRQFTDNGSADCH